MHEYQRWLCVLPKEPLGQERKADPEVLEYRAQACVSTLQVKILSRPQLWESEQLGGRATIKATSEVSSRRNKLCFRGWEVSQSPVVGTSK